MKNTPLFLASQSPRRAQLLTTHGIAFTCIPNKLTIEPPKPSHESSKDWVIQLAKLKVQASASTFKGLILGIDTLIEFEGQVYGKPESISQAKSWLRSFSGNTQHVYTGYYLLNTLTNQIQSGVDDNQLSFHSLSDSQIDQYLATHEVCDKAGGYGIQDCPEFIQSLNGTVESVMGFPKELIAQFRQSTP